MLRSRRHRRHLESLPSAHERESVCVRVCLERESASREITREWCIRDAATLDRRNPRNPSDVARVNRLRRNESKRTHLATVEYCMKHTFAYINCR